MRRVRKAVLIGAAALAALSILAWITGSRTLGAILVGVSLGAVLAPALIAAPAGADRIAREIHFSKKDPRRLVDLEPQEITWGLALVTLWRLRWLIVAGLMLTPALVIGVLRTDVADYIFWQSSLRSMGQTAPSPGAGMLRPDGAIPYFRLVVRALSAGITPWAALPLAASLGVLAAMSLRDITLSPLAALLGEVPVVLIIGAVWFFITRSSALAGGLEVVRVLLLLALFGGLIGATWQVNLICTAQFLRARFALNSEVKTEGQDGDEGRQSV